MFAITLVWDNVFWKSFISTDIKFRQVLASSPVDDVPKFALCCFFDTPVWIIYFVIIIIYYQIYVAIKSLKNASLEGVLEEAVTMQRLSHNYIVKMYGISLPFKEEPLKLVSIWPEYNQTCRQTPLEPENCDCTELSIRVAPAKALEEDVQWPPE